MKSIKQLSILFLLVSTIYSCRNDDDPTATPFTVGFESLSENLSDLSEQSTIKLSFSEKAQFEGNYKLMITESNATYGVDYTTTPEASDNEITINIAAGESTGNFVFNKIKTSISLDAVITFEITEINYDGIGQIQGNSEFTLNNSASLGGTISPDVGGANEPHQVFVDLSKNDFTTAERDSWDLGFYSGDEFRVALNGSIYMMAAPLTGTDIDAIRKTDTEITDLQPLMAMSTDTAVPYVDDPSGDITKTAISEISATDSENKVYLIHQGFEVSTAEPDAGSVSIGGVARGWKKVRILRDGNDYVLQYADLDATTHNEVRISKDTDYNFSHFSFNTNNEVLVQPMKNKWDLGFTVFTNITPPRGPGNNVVYGFSDYVINNINGDAKAYQSDGVSVTYENFTLSNVDTESFTDGQDAVGSGWRNVFKGTVTPDVFYIIKDPAGNIYKVKFLALVSEGGVRGNPKFEYRLLQE